MLIQAEDKKVVSAFWGNRSLQLAFIVSETWQQNSSTSEDPVKVKEVNGFHSLSIVSKR